MLRLFSPSETNEICRKVQEEVKFFIEEQEAGTKPLTQDQIITLLSRDRFAFCHITQYFPTHGTILPRMHCPTPPSEMNPELIAIFNQAFSILRSTVHSGVNAGATPHQDHPTFATNNAIIIIDSLRRGSITGGYLEDVFKIGGVSLSEDAVVLVPTSRQGESGLDRRIEALPKGASQVQYYEGSELTQTVIERILHTQKKPFLIPTAKDPNISFHVYRVKNGCPTEEDDGIQENASISSLRFMEAVNGSLCEHGGTAMAQVETMIIDPPVFSTPPFILEHMTEEALKRAVVAYVVEAKKFAKTPQERHFLESYSIAVQHMIHMFKTAKDSQDLKFQWNVVFKELVKYYDFPVNLRNKVSIETATTKNLILSTHLPFEAYLRSECETIVDAAVSLAVVKDLPLLERLLTERQISYCIEEHRDPISREKITFFVVKGINLPEVATQIYALTTDSLTA